MKLSLFPLAAAACASFALTSFALPALAQKAAASGQDTNFAERMAQNGEAEVALAATALKKSKNPTVDSFARMMDRDHTKNNAQLASIVRGMGGMPPSDVGPQNKAVASRLSALHGAAFDSAYLKSQVVAHQQTKALLQREISAGKNAQLVAYARQTLPVIQRHLSVAQQDVSTMRTGEQKSSSM